MSLMLPSGCRCGWDRTLLIWVMAVDAPLTTDAARTRTRHTSGASANPASFEPPFPLLLPLLAPLRVGPDAGPPSAALVAPAPPDKAADGATEPGGRTTAEYSRV